MTSRITRPVASNWGVNRIQADMISYELLRMEAAMTRLFLRPPDSESRKTRVHEQTFSFIDLVGAALKL